MGGCDKQRRTWRQRKPTSSSRKRHIVSLRLIATRTQGWRKQARYRNDKEGNLCGPQTVSGKTGLFDCWTSLERGIKSNELTFVKEHLFDPLNAAIRDAKILGAQFIICPYLAHPKTGMTAEDAHRCGFGVVVVEDACRGIDMGGSIDAARQAFSGLAIACVAAEAIG